MFLEIITIVTMSIAVAISCFIAYMCYKTAKRLLTTSEDDLKKFKPYGLFRRSRKTSSK
ncbi:MAG: hypothetical protein LBT91_00865 [Bifidobacteriaceae bacterium]|jgi:hypothetical protein|nr:hypothetical protein [Bifidobacteriaceae bacterium]